MNDDAYLYPGADYPDLNTRANQRVRLEVTTSSGVRRVVLRVSDHASGETLVSVEVDPAEWWTLMQGGSQVWPACVSPHLDRLGKRMENQRVDLPAAVAGDTERDLDRDVHRAVSEQLPEDWHDTVEAYDTPRVDNRSQRYTIVRRWL